MPWPAVPHDAIRAGVASICMNSVEQNCTTSDMPFPRGRSESSCHELLMGEEPVIAVITREPKASQRA